jgi:hypothetical protein
MCLRFAFLLITRVASWLRLSWREEARQTAEILILRHHLAVLQRRQPRRPNVNWADRALLAALLSVIPKARRQGLRLLVTPDTILRWHRDIVRRRWAARSRRGTTGRRPAGTSLPWSSGWPVRTPNGGTAGSTASWPGSCRTPGTTPAGTTTGDPGHRTSFIVVPGVPGCLPGRRFPRSRSDGPAASSDTGCPTTAASTTSANPGPHAAPAAPPAPSARRSPGTPQPAAPPAPHAAARPDPPERAHRTQQAIIPIPARQSTTRRDVSCYPTRPQRPWRGMPVFASAISAGWLRVMPRGRCRAR